MNAKNKPSKPEDALKLKGDWKALVKDALEKKQPPGGWPKQPTPERPQPQKQKPHKR